MARITVKDNLMGKRPGSTLNHGMANFEKMKGLELSAVTNKSISFFKTNSVNYIFDSMKNEDYYQKLLKDIDEHGILNAVITTEDGTILAGHSRVECARRLSLRDIPTRLVLSQLDDQKMKEITYLDNLNRFEITPDLRLKLYAELYPSFFKDTRSYAEKLKEHKDNSAIAAPLTEGQVAKELDVSPNVIHYEKQVMAKAIELSELGDPDKVTTEDIKKARKVISQRKNNKNKVPKLTTTTHHADYTEEGYSIIKDLAGDELIRFTLNSFKSKEVLTEAIKAVLSILDGRE